MSLRPLHPRASTTRAQRRQIQLSEESDRALARKMKRNPKTIAKWRRRDSVEDQPMGRKTPRNRSFGLTAEVYVVALRQFTWASLDVMCSRLKRYNSKITRSAIYRAWAKWEVTRTPRTIQPPNFPFARQPGFVARSAEPFQIGAVWTPDEKRVVVFVVGEQSGWTFARTYPELDANAACNFLESTLAELATSAPGASMSELRTPFHEAFCLERSPASTSHSFCKKCAALGIERLIATTVPTFIPILEKGWPHIPKHR